MDDDRDLQREPKGLWDYITHNKETFRVCQWVWYSLLEPQTRQQSKRMLIYVTINIVIRTALPFTMAYMFNGVLAKDLSLITDGFGLCVLCFAVSSVVNYHYGRAREISITHCVANIDESITTLLFEKSLGQHQQESSSLDESSIEKGRANSRAIAELLFFGGVEIILLLLTSFVFLWFLNSVAGAVMTACLLLHGAFSLYLNKKVAKEFTPIEMDWRRLNRYRKERWKKIDRVKTSGKEEEELQYMNKWTYRVVAVDLVFWLRFCLLSNVREVVSKIGFLVIIAYGLWLVWSGEWLIGMLYPLYQWAERVTENMWQLGRIEHQLSWNIPAVKLMMDSLRMPPKVFSVPGAPRICHASPVGIGFQEVSYAYPHSSEEQATEPPALVVKDISFEIAPGEKVALISKSGVGKTTLSRLLLRYDDPNQGCIHINGHKLHEVNVSSWMQAIGYIPQTPQIFDGTIRDNLLYALSAEAQKRVTDEQLWELMRLLQIDFGNRLTKGLDTRVGLNGIKLSGGQAQRLMIGAAAMKRPFFLLLDEPTSSLDSSTEKLVRLGLAEVLFGKVSALVIAHRLSTVRQLCDRFIVLRDASTLEDGQSQIEAIGSSFEELYAISPTFRQLADDQEVVIAA